MSDLVEKVAKVIVYQLERGHPMQNYGYAEAKAAIAAVLKAQLERFDGSPEIQIAISDYAKENGVSLDV